MVSYAIVARLDTTLRLLTAAEKSRNSAFLFSFGRNCPEFRDFAAAARRRTVGPKPEKARFSCKFQKSYFLP